MVEILERLVKQGMPPVPHLRLETYVSPNFMGFFMDETSASVIKDVTVQFTKELESLSIF